MQAKNGFLWIKKMNIQTEIHGLNLPDAGYLRLPAVLKIFPVSRASWWAGVKSGKYPKGVKLSSRCTAWSVTSIRELFERLEMENRLNGGVK